MTTFQLVVTQRGPGKGLNCQREKGHSSIHNCISNKGMKGADKKGLRPDTISDIISALCIPLNNDSISTRTVHLFIPFPLHNEYEEEATFYFFWLKTTSGKVRETAGTNTIDIVRYFKKCLHSHCAAVGSGVRSLRGQVQVKGPPTPPHPRRTVRQRL